LSAWWLVFGLRTLQRLNEFVQHAEFEKNRSMLLMEGSVLIVFLILGGWALVWLTLREQRRFAEAKLFFSTFSHDLKTTVSRLILQTEKNLEVPSRPLSPQETLQNLRSLELQLENSLYFAQHSDRDVVYQEIEFKDLLSRLHMTWPDLKMNFKGTSRIFSDAQAFESILKNLISNSVSHGGADEIEIQMSETDSHSVLEYRDNGQLRETPPSDLGQNVFVSNRGTGLGLYLIRSWVDRLGGRLNMNLEPQKPFSARIEIPRRTR
jgi:signal transduction histidine kinase